MGLSFFIGRQGGHAPSCSSSLNSPLNVPFLQGLQAPPMILGLMGLSFFIGRQGGHAPSCSSSSNSPLNVPFLQGLQAPPTILGLMGLMGLTRLTIIGFLLAIFDFFDHGTCACGRQRCQPALVLSDSEVRASDSSGTISALPSKAVSSGTSAELEAKAAADMSRAIVSIFIIIFY